MPADPTTMLVYGGMPRAAADRLLAEWGLAEPLPTQYGRYLINMLSGDFGTSFYYGRPVWEVLLPRIIATLWIAIPGLLLGSTIGVFLGTVGGWARRGSFTERGSVVLATIIRGIPSFVLGLMLLWVFSAALGWFPYFGMRDPGTADVGLSRYLSFDFLHHLALPVIAVAIHFVPENLLLMRSGIIENRGEDYLELLRAKGLSERKIRWHASRNSMLPVITWVFPSLAETVAGIITTEVVFGWPGVGRELVLSVTRQDYPIAQAALFLMAAMIVVANLLADVVYGQLDPRVAVERSSLAGRVT